MGFDISILNDSKKLTEKQRERAAKIIKAEAAFWAIGVVGNEEIDRINILKASIKAMHLALGKLKQKPQLILVDGNRFYDYKKIPHQCIIGGDGLFASIAAASILAKTHRDKLMLKLHKEYPEYGWADNKAYGTAFHNKAIEEFGITPYHRRTYAPIREYLETNQESF